MKDDRGVVDSLRYPQYDPPEMTLEHHLNADFDLGLRPRWQPPVGVNARRRIGDLAWHALFLAEPGDSVLVPEPAPDDFTSYLRRNGIPVPVLTVDPAQDDRRRHAPFGWSAAAAERNLRSRSPVDHPSLDTIAAVNGRRYSARLESELFGGDHVIAWFENAERLLGALSNVPESPDGWIVKAEHGNAGLGNRRLRGREPDDSDLKVIRHFFDEDDTVVLEHWRPRIRDFCATFAVGPDGRVGDFGLHETVNTADGALIGNMFHEDPAPLAEWRSAMTAAAAAVTGRLAATGYTGPACIDAFVWSDGGRPRLRPLVELNARREISAGASALWRRLGGRGTAYWRFFTRRKLRLPEGYPEIERALGDDAFDAGRGTGVLITAPLWLGADRRSPAKAAVLILGHDRNEVIALDDRIRARFEK